MTDKEILKKAIKKAYEKDGKLFVRFQSIYFHCCKLVQPRAASDFPLEDLNQTHIFGVIFDRSFAKAFFGYFLICPLCGTETKKGCGCKKDYKQYWEFCLESMVLKKERLKYIEKFLKE